MELDELKDCSYKPSKMTREQKELLLKDLCVRLPYSVKLLHTSTNEITNLEMIGNGVIDGNIHDLIENFKPYLFPLSSMTDELWDKEFMGYGITEFTRDSFKYGCETLEFNNDNPHLSSMVRFINQLIKNHFDIYGLIPMGLANDATGLNIY